MKKKVWIIGICIVCLLCGGYLWMNNRKADQYAEDMQYFFDCVEENNLILEEIPSDEAKDSWIEESSNSQDIFEFYNCLINAKALYGEAGHLSVIDPEYYYEIKDIFGMDSPTRKGSVKNAYDDLANIMGIEEKEIVEEQEQQAAGNTDMGISSHQQEGMLVLTIPSFDENLVETQIEKIKEALSSYTGDTLVIDIRENGGGSDEFWSEIVSLTSDKDYRYIATTYGKGDLSKEYVEGVIGEVKESEDGDQFSFQSEYTIESKHFKNYDNIYILTSNTVFSAAENFVRFAKEQGYATLVGEATSGSASNLNPLIVELPNTHLLIRLESTALIPYNTEPDVVCNGYTLDEYIRKIKDYEQTK